MAVFTIGGREVAAELFKAQTFFLSVGKGSVGWDDAMVPPSATLRELVDKVGVTRCREQSYVVPDPDGDIATSDGAKFARSVDPSRYLYLYFKLDLADAQPFTLRETAVCFGVEVSATVPPGQMYIPSADVVAWGKIIQADRFNSIVRDGTIEQSFSTILTL
jgi:hypothetical protein